MADFASLDVSIDNGTGQAVDTVDYGRLPPLAVLLVDDDPFNLQLLQTYLKDDRFTAATAGNGKEALEKIKSETYDIVFMDMEMPMLTGAEAGSAYSGIRNRGRRQ